MLGAGHGQSKVVALGVNPVLVWIDGSMVMVRVRVSYIIFNPSCEGIILNYPLAREDNYEKVFDPFWTLLRS